MNLDYAAGIEAATQHKLLVRAKSDLWFLATEIFEIEAVPGLISRKDCERLPLISESFHRPMIAEWDRMRRLRLDGKGRHMLSLWPREFDKTLLMKIQAVQDYLNDPKCTICWWHAVEEKAQEVCHWISTQLQKNRKLRRLFPSGSLPSENAKRFISAVEFDLPANVAAHSPSFRAYGWTSEATGGHCKKAKLDDVVARSIIEDNQIKKQADWYSNTVCNVLQASGWIDAAGTRWDVYDQYSRWIDSRNWQVHSPL